MEEKSLIHAALRGDLESFNQLVLAYQDSAYNQALWLMHDPYMAEDMVQDAFIRAYQHLPSFRGASFRAWLFRIVRNACYDELRRLKRMKHVSLIQQDFDGEEQDITDRLVDPGSSVEETIERTEMSEMLRRLLEKLPEEYRETIFLVDLQELDYAEAARVMGVPMGTVKSRLARARLQLRRKLAGVPEFFPSVINPVYTTNAIVA